MAASRPARPGLPVCGWRVRALWAELGWAPGTTQGLILPKSIYPVSPSWLRRRWLDSGSVRRCPVIEARGGGGALALGLEA